MQASATEHAQVLVIDDNEVVRQSVTRLLHCAGFTVISAPSALGATQTMVRGQVRVAVVDLDMPEMLGSALVELWRKHPRLAHVGLILLSGKPVTELVSAAAESGADAAVSKLDMHETLVPIVTRLLRHAER